ncbi:hypothetical protein HDV05_008543 [Chytridiales sp. JEL 0842]|nr:hypothetical protein HDV05_008543 [Chytridiales sp. JEL 0842]
MSKILGVGIDIVHLPRIHNVLTRRSPLRFASAIMTKQEITEFQNAFKDAQQSAHQDPVSILDKPFAQPQTNAYGTLPALERRLSCYLGARWAAKEAAYKAFFPHYKLEWGLLSILKKDGKPIAEVDEAVTRQIGDTATHVSLSHDGEYAVAQVVVERRSKTDI